MNDKNEMKLREDVTPPAPPTKTGEIKTPVRYDEGERMIYDADDLAIADVDLYAIADESVDAHGQAIANALNTRTAEREALAQLLTATRAYFHADEDDGSVIDPMLRALTEAERVLAAHQEGREK